jgi:hypothetical protein
MSRLLPYYRRLPSTLFTKKRAIFAFDPFTDTDWRERADPIDGMLDLAASKPAWTPREPLRANHPALGGESLCETLPP